MRKRTKRKVVKLMNPISLAIEGAGITLQQKLDELRLRELAAIDALAIGRGAPQAVYDLQTMVLVAKEMGMGKVGPEALPACEKALQLLDTTLMIHPETEIVTTAPETIDALREVFEYHDLQRQSISRAEYERFIKQVRNRLKSTRT